MFAVAALRFLASRYGRCLIKQRILTGAILLPLLVWFIYAANVFWFDLLAMLINLLALREYLNMTLGPKRVLERHVALGGGIVLLPLALQSQSGLLLLGVAGLVVLMGSLFLFRYHDLDGVISELGRVMLGWCYVTLLLAHLPLLHRLAEGKGWIFLVMLAVMGCDTLAYFVGTTFGKHRLYPAISPKKSIEGAFGGLAGAFVGVLAAKAWLLPGLGLGHALILALLLGTVSQIGDLFESMLKRSVGVKDSGALIPGHGGLLDRLDSLLFAFPLTYYFAVFVA